MMSADAVDGDRLIEGPVPVDVVAGQLRRWAEDLVDLTRRNGLLYFRHTKTASFEFAQDAVTVEAGIESRYGWGFHLPPPPPENSEACHEAPVPAADELVVSLTPPRYRPQIERGLKTLKSKAQAEFLDAGIWVLHLGLGRLDWIDVDTKPARSPLLLVPVALTQDGPGGSWRLTKSDDGEPTLNPALAVKLERDFGIVLPTLDELADGNLAHVLPAVAAAIAGSGWNIEPIAVLRTFSFHKEVIYRDLRDHEPEIASHPIVRLLAEGPSSGVAHDLDFAAEPEDSLDHRHPPEDLACVVEADASQRQCLIAARAGRSFVMDGPPGTGKSQTITNVIAQLLADGKTVLFVSEKAAALEVVQNSLARAKLDPFVMALHSQNATRKAVAQELGRALDEKPTAKPRVDASKRARLTRDRKKLTAYAIAINEVRHPLQLSLHEAIGRIAKMYGLAVVPVAAANTSNLDPTAMAALLDWASQLGRAWGPIERGDGFVWRNLAPGGGGARQEADVRRRVRDAVEALEGLETAALNVAAELRIPAAGGPAATRIVSDLLELVERRVPVGEAWLTADDPEAIAGRVDALASRLRLLGEAESNLTIRCGGWRILDPAMAGQLELLESELRVLNPPLNVLDQFQSSALEQLAKVLEKTAELMGSLAAPAAVLQMAFGVDGPLSLDLLGRLAELGRLAGSPTPPEPAWLNPAAKSALDEARRVLGDLLVTYRSRREALQSTFNESVLTLDLRSLHARFTEVHTGLRKLGGAYRSDRSTLANATVAGKVTKDVVAKLEEAIDWQDLAGRLALAEQRYGPQLGSHYYSSRAHADFDDIERAVTLTDRALALAAGEVDPADLVRQIAMGADPEPRLTPAAGEVSVKLQQLRAGPLHRRLGELALAVERLDMNDAVSWCFAAADSVRRLAAMLGAIDLLVGSTVTLAEARTLTAGRLQVAQLTDAIEADVATLGSALGSLAEAPTPALLLAGRDWVAKVRDHFGGPVRTRSAAALMRTGLTGTVLHDARSFYAKAADALFGEFTEIYGSELSTECDSSFDAARTLLATMATTVADVSEWRTYVAARTSLVELGWGPTVEGCEAQRVPANQVADVIERVVLSRWADEVIDRDDRLDPKRSVDRDELRQTFRILDKELVEDAAAGVINACADRRPRSLAGGAGTIRQQAQLKRRHKPVRWLLAEAGEAVQKLKPCFMMSPLSVSQFLPPGLKFDAVIFDEASQVREADAIGCIYRGSQLIVAGDPKQLPPTDFFSRTTDGDDDGTDDDLLDFESVLDRCKAQGIPELPLNWHYRSRHESLITFSNRSFYDGRLHTFPGATFEAPDLGVELFYVDGVYGRGGTRDNPIEAEVVVDRIVEHRRRHRDLTLGVVALSAAQQCAIEAAIERRSWVEPELRDLVTDDRLDGFFVKNLENVQGDERDLIILSIGYGPDENGKLTMNFGPMNREGGERRLNVAITRARRRVEVVSSVSAGQIVSDKPAICHLGRYLDYADRGTAALALEIGSLAGDAESPFEEEVLRAIVALGYDPVPQVGVAGYRVDIGIRQPTRPGTYALGIECDGATYHSSKVARDRDRLRQQVLEGLGWRIHRVWSTAWFFDRAGEQARLRAAIEGSFRNAESREPEPIAPSQPLEVVVDEVDFEEYPEWAWAYEPPKVTIATPRHLQFTSPSARSVIARQILQVVLGYGPIHHAVLLDVIRVAWDIGRTSSRSRDAFMAALGTLLAGQEIEAAGDFLQGPAFETYVRVPADEEVIPRKAVHVPPAELDLAIVQLLGDAGPCELGILRVAWARLFGWRRVGSDIEVAFDDAVDRLIQKGTVGGPNPLRLLNLATN